MWSSGLLVVIAFIVLGFTAITFLPRNDLRTEPSVERTVPFHFIAYGTFLDAMQDALVAFLFLCHRIPSNEVRRSG